MIMNVGLDLLRDWLAGDTVNDPTHMAVGTGTSNPLATETILVAETVRKTFSAKTKQGDGNITYEMTLTTAEGNGTNIAEGAIFNAASVGEMLNRLTFTPVAKTSAFELKIEIEVEVRRKN